MNIDRNCSIAITRLTLFFKRRLIRWRLCRADFIKIFSEAFKPLQKLKTTGGEQANTKSENQPYPPFIVSAEQRPENQSCAKETWKDLTEWGKFERIYRIGEGLALAAAVVTAVFIGYQWHEMVNASKIANSQLLAMQGQLNVMRADERAWIGAGKIDRSSVSDTNDCYFILHYENTGKTPATHIVIIFGVTTNWGAIPTYGDSPPNISPQLLFPNVESRVDSGVLPPNAVLEAKAGKVPLYDFGIIWYDDTFGIHHWTRFRLVDNINTGFTYPALSGNECDANN